MLQSTRSSGSLRTPPLYCLQAAVGHGLDLLGCLEIFDPIKVTRSSFSALIETFKNEAGIYKFFPYDKPQSFIIKLPRVFACVLTVIYPT